MQTFPSPRRLDQQHWIFDTVANHMAELQFGPDVATATVAGVTNRQRALPYLTAELVADLHIIAHNPGATFVAQMTH